MIRKPEKSATREHHPARFQGSPPSRQAPPRIVIPGDATDITLKIRERSVRLTNLNKLFWPELEVTKRDLIQYYAVIAPALLPHVRDRVMVMKRYPHRGVYSPAGVDRRSRSSKPTQNKAQAKLAHSDQEVVVIRFFLTPGRAKPQRGEHKRQQSTICNPIAGVRLPSRTALRSAR